MNMILKKKPIKVLVPFVFIMLLTLYGIPNVLHKGPNDLVKRDKSVTTETKLRRIIHDNTPQKEIFNGNKRTFGETKGPVLSLDYMHMPLDGRCGKNISNSYERIPEKNSWIPRKMCKTFSGPYHIKLENGEVVPYTNYSFMPLTLHSNYLINNPNICEDLQQNLTFLILVHSAVQHFDKRKALRETWANPMLLKEHTSRLVFIVGKTDKSFVQRHLEDEERVHNDIVQGDFIDDYHNLTHKAVLGHRWIQEHCQNTNFVLKVDDDVVINIFKLIEDVIPVLSNTSNTIACKVRKDVPIGRDDRWAVSYDYFPGYENFPFDFCPGAFALMPLQTSAMLFRASHVTPFLWLDDVYVYGILVKIANLRLHHTESLYNLENDANKCFKEQSACPMLLILTSRSESMYFYWKGIVEQQKELIRKYAYTDQVAILD
ncbi:hypothetical protein ACJMK2_015776 [Sinanodonta woodiana]|uniref:Hexosyltransferase n=1 Tax=Sinanodonta woodiana TaxID=1069815 RepID=A0ABD3USQ6_SINWO